MSTRKKSFVRYLIIPQLLEQWLAHQKFSINILQRNKWPHLLLPTFSSLWFLSEVTDQQLLTLHQLSKPLLNFCVGVYEVGSGVIFNYSLSAIQTSFHCPNSLRVLQSLCLKWLYLANNQCFPQIASQSLSWILNNKLFMNHLPGIRQHWGHLVNGLLWASQ